MRISVVSYINTIPFRFGILNSPIKPDKCTYSYDPPNLCAQNLIDSKVDIGLIPVAAIPILKEHFIFSNYGIAANDEAFSVLLLANQPIENLKEIKLDYQSRSSVAMFKLLEENYLHYNFKFSEGYPNFEEELNGEVGGVVIGDRALKYRDNFKYVYDVASLWKEYTGLPAVFALWVSRMPVSAEFANKFDAMMKYGVDNISEAIKDNKTNLPTHLLYSYLSDKLCYEIKQEHRESVRLFLKLLTKNSVEPNFIDNTL